MAVYEGKQGIASLREKIKLKSKMLVGESAEKITTHMVDESPLGVEVYPSRMGEVYNEVGDFKNSWNIGLGSPDKSVRELMKSVLPLANVADLRISIPCS